MLFGRKFFGKPNGTAAPPKQSKLAFSTKLSSEPVSSKSEEIKDEDDPGLEGGLDGDENNIKKENGEECKENKDVKPEKASLNGKGLITLIRQAMLGKPTHFVP